MSDTPRTDAEFQRITEAECTPRCDSFAHDEACPVVFADVLMRDFARKLERELAVRPEEKPTAPQVELLAWRVLHGDGLTKDEKQYIFDRLMSAPSPQKTIVPKLWGPQDHKTVLERIAYLLRQGGHADYADAVHRIFEAVTTSLPHASMDRKGVVHVTMNNGDSWWFKDGAWHPYVEDSHDMNNDRT